MSATEITETILDQVDTLTAIYEGAYRDSFAVVERYRKTHNGRSPESCDYFLGADVQMARSVTSYEHGMPGTERLDEERLAKVSQRQAEACAAAYAAKIEHKAAGMTDVSVSRMNAAGSFTILGVKDGRQIRIEQSMVIKTSSKGTRFAQFPALVYIDGRKSTEKALLAL
jgi:hypothetical protein